jgi:predicted phage tail protein
MNVVIEGDQTKLETLGQMCSNFDANHYFHDGFLRIYQDRPQTIVRVVNQTNAAQFNYAGSTDRTRTNTVFVKFNNPHKLYKQDVAYAEDRTALIPPAPIISTEIVGFGIADRGQAIRKGRFLIEQEAYAEQVLTYKAGFDHYFIKPGDLIIVSNSINDGQRNGGKIESLIGSGSPVWSNGPYTITFDSALDFTPDGTYYVYFQNGENAQGTSTKVVKAKVTSWVAGYTGAIVTTAVELHNHDENQVDPDPFNGMPYVVAKDNEEVLYRVQRIAEGEHPFEFDVTAQRYSEDRFKKIDDGFISGFAFDTNFPDTYTEGE